MAWSGDEPSSLRRAPSSGLGSKLEIKLGDVRYVCLGWPLLGKADAIFSTRERGKMTHSGLRYRQRM